MAGRWRAIWRQADVTICPVASLERWLKAAKIESGPVFRAVRVLRGKEILGTTALTPGIVADIVKRYAEAAGVDPGLV